MSMWKRLNFSIPDSVYSILESVESAVSEGSVNEQALDELKGINQLFSGLQTLWIHPFQNQVSELRNGYPYLSTVNAIEYLKSKLESIDPSVEHKKYDVAVFSFSSSNYLEFASLLSSVAKNFKLDGIETTVKKAKEYHQLEESKMVLPGALVSPRWSSSSSNGVSLLSSLKSAVGSVEGRTEAALSDPLQDLSDIVQESNDFFADNSNSLSALKDIVSIDGSGQFFSGVTLPALAIKLVAPESDQPLSAILCVVAPDGKGDLIKLVSGL